MKTSFEGFKLVFPFEATQQLDTSFLAKGGRQVVWEGEVKPRTVSIAFPDMERAEAWHRSPEYEAIKPIGLAASVRDFMVVQGI